MVYSLPGTRGNQSDHEPVYPASGIWSLQPVYIHCARMGRTNDSGLRLGYQGVEGGLRLVHALCRSLLEATSRCDR